MTPYRILIAGPAGAGKTSAVAAVSDPPAAGPAAPSSAFATEIPDYGTLTLADSNVIHLFSTAAQAHFDFAWENLPQDGTALILLIDNSRGDPLADLHFYLGAFGRFIRHSAVAIGVTHRDRQATPGLDSYQAELDRAGFGCLPVFEVDARNRRDVRLLIEAALCVLAPAARP